MDNGPGPGLASRAQYRRIFRVVGVVVFAVGLILTVVALVDFFSAFRSDSMAMPSRFPLAFVGLPLLAVGGWLLQAGFLGMAARYAAGETMPVAKDSAAYLTDGEGLFGVGRTVDDKPTDAAGPYCRSCGTRNDDTARFCDGCGHALA